MHCTAYLILGSNMGDRRSNLSSAISLLSANDLIVHKSSKLYETAAYGKTDQAAFYNQALEISTSLSPLDLLGRCLKIEEKIGRVRKEKWGPRIIDIDIAYYENLIVEVEELKIPQSDIENRNFALTALTELAPDHLHPIFLKSNSNLLNTCIDSLPVNTVNA